jgi:tRNA modification GTPase
MSEPRPLRVIQLTPPGRGAVATLRVEGPGATEAVQTEFRARGGCPLAATPLNRPTVGHFGGERGEEVVVCRRSEETVEVHCHGGSAAVARTEQALVAAGCQMLGWREWAAPAHGDPVTTAALQALADAPTERTAAILLDQYHGALARELSEIRQAADRGDSDAARRQRDAIRARIALGRHLIRPWRVVLAGRVNVGKSSLINALAGYRRSIVHPAAGTTRDAVTVATAIDGWPVELCDTAGLRTGGDPLEVAGIQRAYERIARADLIVLTSDQSAAWSGEDQRLIERWPDALVVHNKSDLAAAAGDRPGGVKTSAARGDGIDALLRAIARRLVPNPPPAGAAVPSTEKQIAALDGVLGKA